MTADAIPPPTIWMQLEEIKSVLREEHRIKYVTDYGYVVFRTSSGRERYAGCVAVVCASAFYETIRDVFNDHNVRVDCWMHLV